MSRLDLVEKIQSYITLEVNILLWFALSSGFIFYKLWLVKISSKRNGNLRLRFKKTSWGAFRPFSSCIGRRKH